MKRAKAQMVFFLTCIALVWFDNVAPPRHTAQHIAWQVDARGG